MFTALAAGIQFVVPLLGAQIDVLTGNPTLHVSLVFGAAVHYSSLWHHRVFVVDGGTYHHTTCYPNPLINAWGMLLADLHGVCVGITAALVAVTDLGFPVIVVAIATVQKLRRSGYGSVRTASNRERLDDPSVLELNDLFLSITLFATALSGYSVTDRPVSVFPALTVVPLGGWLSMDLS